MLMCDHPGHYEKMRAQARRCRVLVHGLSSGTDIGTLEALARESDAAAEVCIRCRVLGTVDVCCAKPVTA